MHHEILSAAQAIAPELTTWRRHIHQHPELQMDTPETEAYICRILREIGIEDIRSGIGGHGVAAVIPGGKPGKCLGIRVDCDALPIREETGLPFASTNGSMHACGHDAHTAAGLGAAKLLWDRRDQLTGSVKLIFQPYEEGDGGAKAMIADGVMMNPAVDAVIGYHIGTLMGQQYENGDVVFTDQPDSANIYAFRATFCGESAHVCAPQRGTDAIFMACSAVMNLQEIMNRERDPNETAILSVNTIHGGQRNNVVADRCVIEGTIRTFDRETHLYYVNRMQEICRGTAAMLRGTVEFETTIDVMATRIDAGLYRKFSEAAAALVPAEKLRRYEPVAPSGEDFARFADLVPGVHFFVCSKPVNGPCYPHHHPKFDIDEGTLPLAAALFTAFAMTWQEP